MYTVTSTKPKTATFKEEQAREGECIVEKFETKLEALRVAVTKQKTHRKVVVMEGEIQIF